MKTRPLAREEIGFLAALFQGSAPIQVVRAIVYLVGSLLIIVASIFALFGINNFFSGIKGRRRSNRVLKTQTIREMDQNEIKEHLVSHYESFGIDGLKELQKLINEPNRIEWVTPSARWTVRGHHQFHDRLTENQIVEIEHRSFGSRPALHALTKVGVLEKGEDDNPIVDATFGEVVDNLLSELEN